MRKHIAASKRTDSSFALGGQAALVKLRLQEPQINTLCFFNGERERVLYYRASCSPCKM